MTPNDEVLARVQRYVTLQYDEYRPSVDDLRHLLTLARNPVLMEEVRDVGEEVERLINLAGGRVSPSEARRARETFRTLLFKLTSMGEGQ